MRYKTTLTKHVVLHYMVDYKTGSSQIRYIFKKLYLSSKIARWQMLLVEYDIEYMTRKTVK
jgi:hypothetical protein